MISAQQAAVISDGIFKSKLPELLNFLSRQINQAAESGESTVKYHCAYGLDWKNISSSNQKIIHQELEKLGFYTASVIDHLKIRW